MRKVLTFWDRVAKSTDPNGCWAWTGAKTAGGYGEWWFNRRMVYAHRHSLFLAGVEIPPGQVVDHLCRQRDCVRPDHLRVTTHRGNILAGAGASARNALKATCKHGHPFDQANTWVNRKGVRFCRTCRRERDVLYGERIRAYDRARYARQKQRETAA